MIKPVWGYLTVRPKTIEETDDVIKSAKQSGIIIPESSESDRRQQGQIVGELLAVGGNCFDGWGEPKPKPGDLVLFDKFAGINKSTENDEERNFVRIISDTDIMAIMENDNE